MYYTSESFCVIKFTHHIKTLIASKVCYKCFISGHMTSDQSGELSVKWDDFDHVTFNQLNSMWSSFRLFENGCLFLKNITQFYYCVGGSSIQLTMSVELISGVYVTSQAGKIYPTFFI